MLATRMLQAAAAPGSAPAYANTVVLDVSKVPPYAEYTDDPYSPPGFVAQMDPTLNVPTFENTDLNFMNSIALTSLPLSSVFRITADLELVSDAQGYEHMGFWPSDGTDWEGYRAAHLNNGGPLYVFSRWAAPLTSSSETPISTTLDATPAWTVGSRGPWVLTRDTNGVFSLSVSGQLVFSQGDTTYAPLMPGLFLYGCKIALHGLTYEYD